MSLDTTPDTWGAGEIPTAAKMNAEIRDALAGIQDAWDVYTPTWTGSVTNPVIGDGTLTGAYLQVGKTFHFRISITMGSTTTYGSGGWLLALPAVPIVPHLLVMGVARDTSASQSFPIAGERAGTSGSSLSLRVWPTTAGNPFSGITSTTPFAWGTGDILSLTGTFEAA